MFAPGIKKKVILKYKTYSWQKLSPTMECASPNNWCISCNIGTEKYVAFFCGRFFFNS